MIEHVLSVLAAVAALAITPQERDSVLAGSIEPQRARLEARLSVLEFSLLHAAAVDGVTRYGGDADFDVKLAKAGDAIVTTVTIDNPKLLDVWTFWMAERTSEIVGMVDVDNLDEASRLALKTAQAVNAKLANAKANPIYDPLTVAGTVVADDGGLYLDTDLGRARVLGELGGELALYGGHSVVATGYVKTQGEMEVTRFAELKANTLELFTMSDCPFGKQAEFSILNYVLNLALPAVRPAPELEVHYIFYRQPPAKEGDAPTFTALHGEKEIQESLVQIVIRDTFPWLFHDYLLERTSSDVAWPELARKVGITDADIELIRARIASERDELIQAEYDYATRRHAVFDGSPTYVWEGRVVTDIRQLPAFKGLEFSSPSTCRS